MTETSIINLVEELFTITPENQRCEYLRKDEHGPYCSRGLKENREIIMPRRDICANTFTFRDRCMDLEQCPNCPIYQGQPFRGY